MSTTTASSSSTPTPLLTHLLTHESFRAARLPSLYSDFRHLRTNNPSGFTANTTAWASALAGAARAGVLPDTLVVRTGEELVAALATREWGRPLGLGSVVAEAVQKREWFPLKVFMAQVESVYYRAWINPWGLLSWGLETAGLKGRGEGEVRAGEFVVLKNVEESAQKLLTQISLLPNGTHRLFTLPLLLKTYPNPLTNTPYTARDLKVLLKFLTRDLRAATLSGETIKFKNENEDPTPVTPTDTTIAELKATIANLHAQIDHLSAQIGACTDKARAALQNKNRIVAVAALKSKKLAEATLERRVGALGQLEEVLGRIEQATGNAELVAQLKRSTKVLRALNRETGGVEAVDAVVGEMREQIDGVEEVTRVLGEVGLEDGEVEEEMEELLEEEERRKEVEKEEREKERRRKVMEELGRLRLKGEEEEQLLREEEDQGTVGTIGREEVDEKIKAPLPAS
ncbi:uncharacterized protein LAJ45_05262 [Morchella importuna]|uniref:uncharacterized protein n=1 Tax=Morchella importuna TaxID=1174673 RepID=UPI001E8D229B|nr:uncharacterized protein LAJ45_05262 [Morchella importuna]KAH8150566.1 hypothetical protein LAJ45_05262 [Morchella importuna]